MTKHLPRGTVRARHVGDVSLPLRDEAQLDQCVRPTFAHSVLQVARAGFVQVRVEILPLDPPVACVLAVRPADGPASGPAGGGP